MPDHPVRQHLETFLARWGMRAIPALSRKGVLRWATFLGGAAYLFSPHLRAVGRANLDLAFGDTLADTRKRQILKHSFRSFALAILDTFWMSRNTAERLKEIVVYHPGFDRLLQPQAMICVTAHLGNWEVLGMAFSARGYPLNSVAAPIENEKVDEILNQLRKVTGQKVLSKHGVLRSLLKVLKDGGRIALLLDQNTRVEDGGMFVDFFGLPVPVSPIGGVLWHHTQARVLVSACIPQPDGRYLAVEPKEISIPHDGSIPKGDVSRIMTEAITRATEDLVRAYPDCWLWTYKRWKYIAPGRTKEDYPFYAKQPRATRGNSTKAQT